MNLLRSARVLLALSLVSAPAWAGDPAHVARIRESVAFDQKLGVQIDRALAFIDDDGQRVTLGELLQGRPVILTPVYYGCPMLCTQVLNGLVDALGKIDYELGRDFDIVSFSIDPRDTPDVARAKKQGYLERLGRFQSPTAWHFLCADPATTRPASTEADSDGAPHDSAIEALTSSIGFRYAYDKEIDEYAHAGGVVVLTPDGRASKYLYGIDPSPRDVRLSIVESSDGKVGSFADQMFLWLCYHYDPITGKYAFAVLNVVRAAGLLMVALIVGYVFVQLRRERAALRPVTRG
jgi:protein SCO1